LPVPPLLEQRAIAHILGTLDDKIELNRRMNETLEAMVRAIFKSWFVDFDPVRAKAEGRDPGLPKPLADLFPARLVDSALGVIPEGWEVKKLGDLLELAYGRALRAEDRHDGNIPVYGSNGQVGWHDERLVAGPGIVVGRKGNPGIVTWVPTDFFPIDTSFYVVPKSSSGGLQFLFQVLSTHDLASLGADSAVPGLNRNLAYMSGQLLPPSPLLTQFERLASAFSRRENSVNDQSRTLSALRDSLLPKLISGELRLDDAKKFIAGVAP
jgi:type I restriction enzyme S subunit